jgi:hypothetical protein
MKDEPVEDLGSALMDALSKRRVALEDDDDLT